MAHIITFIVFGGLGLMLLFVGSTQWLQQRRALANAQHVPATIAQSQVFSSTSTTDIAYVDRAQPSKAFLVAEASHAPAVFIVLGLLLVPPLAWFIGKLV